ncbi:hypothetical protein BDV33DRAFT_130874 [Aspergillus novoparasiticus]|uniref:Uncharacterized protein n=1 Tax=Aspergillus novoparasiticus TaxID=986946 RepID=A0A5N6EL78_9EURO|nr:hypothetical protein BDV33DRAFT_130874 [Aspergillus novoparasiticus]
MRGKQPRYSKGKRGRQGSWMIPGGPSICVHPTCRDSGESQITEVEHPNLLPRGGPGHAVIHMFRTFFHVSAGQRTSLLEDPPFLQDSWLREDPVSCRQYVHISLQYPGESPVICQAEAGRSLRKLRCCPLYKHLGRYDPKNQPRVISNQEAKPRNVPELLDCYR